MHLNGSAPTDYARFSPGWWSRLFHLDLLEQNAQSPKLLNGYSDENATPQYTQKAKPQKRGLLSGETNTATSSRCNRRWMRRGGSEGPTHENSHVSTTPRSNTSIVLPSRIRPGRRRCHTTQTSGGPQPSKQGHKDQAHSKAYSILEARLQKRPTQRSPYSGLEGEKNLFYPPP